jgi:hypothetical protein
VSAVKGWAMLTMIGESLISLTLARWWSRVR